MIKALFPSEVIGRGTLPSYSFVTYRYRRHSVHDIRVTGPLTLAERLPLYRETLKLTVSDHFFCILDNSEGHENELSNEDIQKLDDIIVSAGISWFFGATVTGDTYYPKMVDLASINMEKIGLKGELLSTSDRTRAEAFLVERVRRSD